MSATHPSLVCKQSGSTVTSAWLFGTLLLMFSAAGCRTTTDNQIDLLERELRAQEDYIYELEDYILEYSQKLRGLRMHGGTVTGTVDSESGPEIADEPPLDDGPAIADEPEETGVVPLRPRSRTPTIDPSATPDDIDIPDLEIGGPTSQSTPQPSARNAAVGAAMPDPTGFAVSESRDQAEEPAAESQADVQLASAEEELTAQTNAIEITQLFGEQPVESLLTVIELKDAEQSVVEASGRVSLLVLDTSVSKPKKLHQWDFTPEESTEAWQSTPLGSGLHLELPLEGVELPEAKLELWARFTTYDGRKLLTRRRFQPLKLASVGSVPEPSPLPLPVEGANEIRVTVAPERMEEHEALSPPPQKGTAEVRILTQPITEKAAPRPAGDGWRTSEKAKRPAPVKRAIAAIQAGPKSGGWKQSSTDRRVQTASAEKAIPTWKVSTQPKKAPDWSPYR
ncbi:MAG: hypothetical protein AAGA92_00190 [Planctomycetota bacterium]